MVTEKSEKDHSDRQGDDVEPSSKWIRVRRSRLINVDKINQVSIQRRYGSYFLEVLADREIVIELADLKSGLEALEALQAGEMDISAYTVPKAFMKNH